MPPQQPQQPQVPQSPQQPPAPPVQPPSPPPAPPPPPMPPTPPPVRPPMQPPPVQKMPSAPPMPPAATAAAEPASHTGIILTIALLIILALAAGAGYFAWSQGLLSAYLPQAEPVVEEEQAPPQTETSDLESDLQSVELGADTQLEMYESEL